MLLLPPPPPPPPPPPGRERRRTAVVLSKIVIRPIWCFVNARIKRDLEYALHLLFESSHSNYTKSYIFGSLVRHIRLLLSRRGSYFGET